MIKSGDAFYLDVTHSGVVFISGTVRDSPGYLNFQINQIFIPGTYQLVNRKLGDQIKVKRSLLRRSFLSALTKWTKYTQIRHAIIEATFNDGDHRYLDVKRILKSGYDPHSRDIDSIPF